MSERKGIGFAGTVRNGIASKRGTLEVVRIGEANIVAIDGLRFDATDEQMLRLAHWINANIDLDPPSYLPVREPLRPRIPDLCPDESRDER